MLNKLLVLIFAMVLWSGVVLGEESSGLSPLYFATHSGKSDGNDLFKNLREYDPDIQNQELANLFFYSEMPMIIRDISGVRMSPTDMYRLVKIFGPPLEEGNTGDFIRSSHYRQQLFIHWADQIVLLKKESPSKKLSAEDLFGLLVVPIYNKVVSDMFAELLEQPAATAPPTPSEQTSDADEWEDL